MQLVYTFCVTGVSVVIFFMLDLPLPFFFGSMSGSLLLALAGKPITQFTKLTSLARTILGVAIGSSITLAFVRNIGTVAQSAALIPLYIIVIGVFGYLLFRYVYKYDPITAYFATMPGGLLEMISVGEQMGAQIRVLSLIHATRVFIIVTLAPVFLSWFSSVNYAEPIGEFAHAMPVTQLILLLICSLVGWQMARIVGMFGASLFGPMLFAAVLSLTNLLTAKPPTEAILFAQFFIGMSIGSHFVGITLRELRQIISAGMVYVAITATVAIMFAVFITRMNLAPPIDAFLAFAPGGQAEMVILAIIAGADLGYVITHHLLRMVLVIVIGIPIITRLTRMFGLTKKK